MQRTIRYLASRIKLTKSTLKQNHRYCWCSYLQRASYTSASPWSHRGELGPDNWAEWYPDARGSCQSPIALYSDADHRPLNLQLSGYNQPANLTATNVGFTVSFQGECTKMANSPCYITGAHGWLEKYSFNHLHMHWGETSEEGSEHTIDDQRFPMELHIVHCLGNLSLPEAVEQPKGLAVLGFVYEISEEDNEAYTPLLDAIRHVTYKDEEKEVVSSPSLTLASLLPPVLESSYFYYSGSLTTPPCSEVVQWTVFSYPIPISERQMQVFRSLQRCSGKGCVEPMSGNWRPLQESFGRLIYQSTSVDFLDSK
ncbi:carbonic anhydrase 3-like [Watersipora subatra]|uniref:carbonic anhydrase 3-like n=1 Tax=Watersipora subatra TaxID=2589382 RepID=UPI00355C28E8